MPDWLFDGDSMDEAERKQEAERALEAERRREAERKAIEAVIRDYLDGMVHPDFERLRSALHPLFVQSGHYKGQFEFFDRDAFVELLESEHADGAEIEHQAEITLVDITGDIAVAKVTSEFRDTSFTDYLTLIMVENRWQIVMGLFFDHAGPEPLH